MDAFLIIAAVGSLCCITLGVYVLSQDREKLLNRLFFLMSISLAGFIFTANLCYTSETIEILVARYKISSFFCSSYYAINLHFNVIFTKHRLKFWHTVLLYLPVPIVIITTFTDQSLFSDFIRNGHIWNFIPAYKSFGFYFYLFYSMAYVFISIVLVEIYRRRTKLNKEKRQAKIINLAYLAPLISGTMFAFFLPLFNIYSFSQLGPNTFLIYFFAIFYSVFRFKFLNLAPTVMADEIIEHIGEMILLLDNDFNITMSNNKSIEMLGIGTENLKKKSFFDLIRNSEDIKDKINDCLKSKEKSLLHVINYKKENEDILTDTYISRIYDKFEDHTGFLVISRENKGRIQVQKAYKISEREFEVIELLLSGLSNKTIGERLGITERTVEAHCLHIYSKIGIKDRIELFGFANEFNLLPKK
jgi:PAS domain S-box-containing protein